MVKTVRVLFDGEVLRPQEPVDLEPNSSYIVTIEDQVSASPEGSGEDYPLTQIRRLATDLGIADFSTRHGAYAHGGPQTENDSP